LPSVINSIDQSLGHKGQQGDMARSFDSDGQRSLVLGTRPRLSTWANATEFIYIPFQHFVIFVINHVNFINTEGTDAAARPSTASSSS
jgi:hypothetical protein